MQLDFNDFAVCGSCSSMWKTHKENITQCPFCDECLSVTGDNNDYNISKGVLLKYTGMGGDITLPDGIISIGAFVFKGVAIRSVVLPSSIETIENDAFSWCEELHTMVCSNGLTYIGKCAFEGCNLSSIKLPKSVRFIGDSAFACNDNLSLDEDMSRFIFELNPKALE